MKKYKNIYKCLFAVLFIIVILICSTSCDNDGYKYKPADGNLVEVQNYIETGNGNIESLSFQPILGGFDNIVTGYKIKL